ncbi:MAG: hypothetical protein NDI62_03175 [Burkholderiales bacterium]|nr:hypothetical protein [Burkholderiales bacterium]
MEHFKRDKTFFIQLMFNAVAFFMIFATVILIITMFVNDFKAELVTLVLMTGFSIFLSFVVLIGIKKFEHSRIISVVTIFIGIFMMFNERNIYFMNEILSYQNFKVVGVVLLFLYVFYFSYLCFKIAREEELEKVRPYHNDEGLKLNRD